MSSTSGTGKLAASVRSVEEGENAPVMQNPEHTPPEDAGRTLSKGVGSLLWMAPEVLRGSRLKERQVRAAFVIQERHRRHLIVIELAGVGAGCLQLCHRNVRNLGPASSVGRD